jgi:hypothetical protein
MARRTVKTLANRGGGPPPGYRWTVQVLDAAWKEADDLLDEAQMAYLASQVRDLAREPDPTHPPTLDVDDLGDFLELRDWGGVLHPINLRVFFFLDHPRRDIVILGVIHKKNDGPTPRAVVLRMQRRRRNYVQTIENR